MAISVPPSAVLGGLLIIIGFAMSPAEVVVPNTDWKEPILVWLTICMQTGSRKLKLHQYLLKVIRKAKESISESEGMILYIYYCDIACTQLLVYTSF